MPFPPSSKKPGTTRKPGGPKRPPPTPGQAKLPPMPQAKLPQAKLPAMGQPPLPTQAAPIKGPPMPQGGGITPPPGVGVAPPLPQAQPMGSSNSLPGGGMPPGAPPGPLPGGFAGMPKMGAMDPALLASAPPAPVVPSGATPPAPVPPGAAAAAASLQTGAAAAAAAPKEEERPEVPESTQNQIKDWWQQSDNLTQRANALWEFREANKTLFPARFDPTDPTRGQTSIEVATGRDKRRVRVGRIFRDSLQTTALTVPEDIDFHWAPSPQATPSEQTTGIPQTTSIDPVTPQFAKTLTIVERALLDEAGIVRKAQAWVQDASVYPMAVLKYCFRREFSTTYLNSTPPDKDTSDGAARLEALVQAYAQKEFDESDQRFAQMLDIVKSMQQKARLTRWFGIDLQLLPLDSFGISEDAKDLVDIYDAQFMFQDALYTGEELLARFPYNATPDDHGNTFGIRKDELTNATPWDGENTSTDPNSKLRTSRNRQSTTARPGSGLSAMKSNGMIDPLKKKYLVRELWSKRTRTVYTMLKGAKHYLDVRIPQNTSERWYPFALLAPNRVPTEIYGASDLELKREIQARINRKRTDEEKARWLSLDRLIYNTQALDSKEAIKLGDIEPGRAKGINLGSPSAKIGEAIMTFAYQFKPEAFDTSKDERDMDMMGALPSQATGSTGVANYAAEVEVAAQGAAAAIKQRQNIVQREFQGLLQAVAEVLLQEITPEEARRIAGPFAFWPVIYDDDQAEQVIESVRQQAIQQVAPQVMAATAQGMMTGIPPDVQAIQAQLEQLAAPIWQATLVNTYGTTEPVTRETIYRRLKVKVKSTLLSTLDRQSRIQSVTLMAQALLQMTQAAQTAMVPFNPRTLLKKAALLIDDTEDFDEMFPAVSPLDAAAAANPAAAPGAAPGAPGAPKPGGGAPSAQGVQAKQGTPAEKSRGATEGGGRPDAHTAAQKKVA